MPEPLDLVWIVLVLGLVFYLAWLVTRFVAVRARGKSAGRLMRVVDRMNVANDKAILLVEIGGEYCVIGVTGHEMRLLKTLSAEEAEAARTGAEPHAQASGEAPEGSFWQGMQTFSGRLGMAMKRPGPKSAPKPGPSEEATPEDGGLSAIDRMNERIRLRKETKRR